MFYLTGSGLMVKFLLLIRVLLLSFQMKLRSVVFLTQPFLHFPNNFIFMKFFVPTKLFHEDETSLVLSVCEVFVCQHVFDIYLIILPALLDDVTLAPDFNFFHT